MIFIAVSVYLNIKSCLKTLMEGSPDYLKDKKVSLALLAIIVIALVLVLISPLETPTEENMTAACGDGTCSLGESCTSCPADCGECPKDAGLFDDLLEDLPETVCNMSDGDSHMKALDTLQLEYCECIDDEDLKADCKETVTGNLYYRKATTTYDMKLCYEIEHIYARESCISIVESGLENILEEDPEYLIQLFTESGNYEDAIPILEDMLEQNPNDYSVTITLARIYADDAWTEVAASGENITRALDLLDSAIAIHPDDAAPYRFKGHLYKVTGEMDKALESLNKSLEIDPEYIGALVERGHAYRMKGDYDSAFKDLNKAKGLDPERTEMDIYAHLCTMQSNIGEMLDEAIENCEIVINYEGTLSPRQKSEAHMSLGKMYMNTGDYNMSLSHFRSAEINSPEDPAVYTYMARLYNHIGDYTKAEENANEAIGYNPNIATAYSELGYALYKQGRIEEAITAAEDGLEVVDDDPTLLALTRPVTTRSLYYLLADIQHGLGNTEKEQEYLQLGDKAFEEGMEGLVV